MENFLECNIHVFGCNEGYNGKQLLEKVKKIMIKI